MHGYKTLPILGGDKSFPFRNSVSQSLDITPRQCCVIVMGKYSNAKTPAGTSENQKKPAGAGVFPRTKACAKKL